MISNFKCKITEANITYGPTDPDELTAMTFAYDLMQKGYRKTSNAFCHVSRIDREDWLQAIQSNGGQNYVQLQAIEKWDGKLPVTMMGGSSVPFVNIGK